MIFPINTDAPIYHFPGATLLLIVVNVFIFAITGGGAESSWEVWMLKYGEGLRPLEWLTCNFLHFGVLHLVANMVFLWGFGLVVEGKLGWFRFVPVYLGIGVVHACIEQLLMLNYAGPVEGAGGASGAIFGLMAMSLVWAPRNDMTCMLFLFVRVSTFDVSILTFSLLYIGMELLFAWLGEFAMSSEMIHLLGAAVGFVIATVMLKFDWVDCEGWDLFAVLKGTHGSRR